MLISFHYEKVSACCEIRRYKSLVLGKKLKSRDCVAVSKYAKKKSGWYLVDRQGRVREAQ